VFFVNTIKVNEGQCWFGPHWLLMVWRKNIIQHISTMFHRR